jgi:hypothetical protein
MTAVTVPTLACGTGFAPERRAAGSIKDVTRPQYSEGRLLGDDEAGAVGVEDDVVAEDGSEAAAQVPAVSQVRQGLPGLLEGDDPPVIAGDRPPSWQRGRASAVMRRRMADASWVARCGVSRLGTGRSPLTWTHASLCSYQ